MSESTLLNFTGEDLTIVGNPVTRSETEIDVTLEGRQSDDQFLSFCQNDPSSVIVAPRRFAEAHRIGIHANDIQIKNGKLVVHARLTQLSEDVRCNTLPLLREGMNIAKPHHFDGRKPISTDRLFAALQQGHIEMDQDNVDMLPDTVDESTIFIANAETGELRYYPQTPDDRLPTLMQQRLFAQPSAINMYSKPVWVPRKDALVAPHEYITQCVHGLRSDLFSVQALKQGTESNGTSIVIDPDSSFYMTDRNDSKEVKPMNRVQFSFVDRRRSPLVIPTKKQERAQDILTDYDQASALLDRLHSLSGGDRKKRPAALLLNNDGIQEVSTTLNSPWVATNKSSAVESRIGDDRASTLLQPLNEHVLQGRNSSELQLLRRMRKYGMDAGGMIVSETFPQHASLDALAAEEVYARMSGIQSLLFRYASADHGDYMSKHDYTALENLLQLGKHVYWAHPTISHWNDDAYKQGTLLQLTATSKDHNNEPFSSLAFVPADRIQEFQEGLHVAFFGTARCLRDEQIQLMERIFERIAPLTEKKNMIIHSGGGPNASTMGVANRLAREYQRKGDKFMSIGHVLGVKKEPMNDHLDGLMAFRNNARDVRQGNMAAAAEINAATEGGGGTREEKGICQTDIAIARDKPMPLILIDSDFYEHEYQQYLREVKDGTLDDFVLECISLIDTEEQAEQIIRAYIETGEVISIVPDRFQQAREEALAGFKQISPERKRAWNPEA